MAWAAFRAVYDNEGINAVTINRQFLLPPIGINQAFSPYYLQCGFSSQSVASGEIVTTNIERCQIGIGKTLAYKSLDDITLLCDARDPMLPTTNGFRFQRNGIWDQVLCRSDPFTTRFMYVRARVDKSVVTDLARIIFKLHYEVINISYFQARVLDSTNVWIG